MQYPFLGDALAHAARIPGGTVYRVSLQMQCSALQHRPYVMQFASGNSARAVADMLAAVAHDLRALAHECECRDRELTSRVNGAERLRIAAAAPEFPGGKIKTP